MLRSATLKIIDLEHFTKQIPKLTKLLFMGSFVYYGNKNRGAIFVFFGEIFK